MRPDALHYKHTNRKQIMIINKITIKFLGKKESMYRVLDDAGEVLQVFMTKEEAEAFING